MMGEFMLMPKLGMTMESGKILKWLCQEGETIEKGQAVVEVQTDKVSLEVESLLDGTLLKIYSKEGETVLVNSPIAYIGVVGESIPPVETAESGTAIEVKSSEEVKDDSSDGTDLVVIGGGPGGYVAAIRAAQLGAKVVLVEKDKLGGTCLNRGCIPTKVLFNSAEAWRNILESAAMGISVNDATFDWGKIIARKNTVVNQLVTGVDGLLKKNSIEIVKGVAKVIDSSNVHVTYTGGRSDTIKTRNIILATGTVPGNIPLAISPNVNVYDINGILDLEELPKSMVIIGGGIMGVEIATIFRTFGVDVSIIEIMPTILPTVDEELVVIAQEELRQQGIKLINGIQITSIEKSDKTNRVVMANNSTIEAEVIMVSVGRKPQTEAYNSLNLKLDEKGYILVNEKMETNTKNIYAIGDITGKIQLAHVASAQGIIAAENIMGKVNTMEYNAIPNCVWIHPQIAYVGLTEREVKKRNIPYKTFKFPFYANGKAVALGNTKGFVKIITDTRWDEIIGVHIIGPNATDLIAEAVIAMKLEATCEDLARAIHAHPTLSEALMEAAAGIKGEAIHI
jgi:dihydrolipoamide dehydrogenase